MPVRKARTKSKSRAVVRRKHRVRGGSLFSWIRHKAMPWLKKKRAISRLGSALGMVGVPYAGTVGKVASAMGYGKRRRGAKMVKMRRTRGRGLGHTGGGRKKKACRKRKKCLR